MERKHLINIGLSATLLAGCSGTVIKTGNPEANIPPSQTPITATFTPFQPEAFVPTVSTETPIPTPTPERPVPYKMFGIDFADSGKKIDLKITLPSGKSFDSDATPTVCETVDPYHSLFLPGNHVTCEYQFKTNYEDMAHFAHSGWYHEPNASGGINYISLEAESIRHYLEDATPYLDDKKRLTLTQIGQRMTDFLNANVEISQGEISTEGLKVLAITRVPPDKFGPFDPNSGLTNEDILSTLGSIDPAFSEFVTDGKPEIIVIFCGWHSPQEDNINTSGSGFYDWSRYAVAIGK